MLATFHAGSISGNLSWIEDALARQEQPVPVTILAARPRTGLIGLAAAAVAALRAGWLLATSRLFIVDDYFFPMYVIRPRRGTRFVQTWHACGAFKRFGYGLRQRSFGADEATVAAYPIHTNYSVCLVSAQRFAPIYAEAFRQPLDRFTSTIGIPRTDLFFDEPRQAQAITAIRGRYGISSSDRVILYAPTFRGASTTAARAPDGLNLETLRRSLGQDHVILVRQHPFVRAQPVATAGPRSFAMEVSDWPDINELMLVSDVLITDYSSAMYEFSLLGRPMIFFAPDHADFERERGLYFDYRTGVPGPVFETTEEVARYLRAGVFDLERVARFRAESFEVADGHASERFVDRIVVPALR